METGSGGGLVNCVVLVALDKDLISCLQNVNEVTSVMAFEAPQYGVITESLHVVLRISNAVKYLTNDSCVS
jgi:hypothetical protein